MFETKPGDINGWYCGQCGLHTYVVHVDPGVTPMFLGCCRASGGCKGPGISLMYPTAPPPEHVKLSVKHEWYKPGKRARLSPEEREHVKKGGLLLRELTDAGRKLLWPDEH